MVNVSGRIVAAGRGRIIQHPNIKREILKLSGKTKSHVVYLGAATFESDAGYDAQAKGFLDDGCTVEHLKLTELSNSRLNKQSIKASIRKADIIAVSGGNTLFAMNKFRQLGVDKMLHEAMNRGCVMSGGSAGAICWFGSGHSDSRDPTTIYRVKKE